MYIKRSKRTMRIEMITWKKETERKKNSQQNEMFVDWQPERMGMERREKIVRKMAKNSRIKRNEREKEENQKLQKKSHTSGWFGVRAWVRVANSLNPPKQKKLISLKLDQLWPTDRRAMSSTTEKLFSTAVVVFYRVWKGKCENNLAVFFFVHVPQALLTHPFGAGARTPTECVYVRDGEQKHFSGPQWTLFAVTIRQKKKKKNNTQKSREKNSFHFIYETFIFLYTFYPRPTVCRLRQTSNPSQAFQLASVVLCSFVYTIPTASSFSPSTLCAPCHCHAYLPRLITADAVVWRRTGRKNTT